MHDWAGKHHDLSSGFSAAGPARVYDLAVRLEVGMSHHPAHPPYAFTLTKEHGDFPYGNGITAVSEAFTMGAHIGTHVDALGHVAYCGEIHGGHQIADHHTLAGGLEIGSTEEIPPLIGPGHLIDAEELFGRELTIEDDIGATELAAWFDDHTPPGPGSIVLIRTGWMKYWDDVNKYIGIQIGLPGLTREGAEWLSERGILAAGSDTMNLERKKASVVCLDVHRHFLVERGIYIMESLQLETAAAAGVRDFTFFAAPSASKAPPAPPSAPWRSSTNSARRDSPGCDSGWVKPQPGESRVSRVDPAIGGGTPETWEYLGDGEGWRRSWRGFAARRPVRA